MSTTDLPSDQPAIKEEKSKDQHHTDGITLDEPTLYSQDLTLRLCEFEEAQERERQEYDLRLQKPSVVSLHQTCFSYIVLCIG